MGSPYLITGDITIPNDSSLRIEPGVTVEFQGHYELLVNGRLLAIGTQTDTILFTIKDTTGWSNRGTTLGGWKHIRLFEPAVTNDSTIFAFCRIQYGKAIGPNWPFNHGGGISVVGFNKVRISDCLIAYIMSGGEQGPSGGGVGVTSCDILLSGNTIVYNHSHAGGGIHLSHSNTILQYNLIRGNSATGNGGGIEILGDNTRPAVVTFLGDTVTLKSKPRFPHNHVVDRAFELPPIKLLSVHMRPMQVQPQEGDQRQQREAQSIELRSRSLPSSPLPASRT